MLLSLIDLLQYIPGFVQGGHPKKSELFIKLRDIALSLLSNGFPETPIVLNNDLLEQNLIPMNESYYVSNF